MSLDEYQPPPTVKAALKCGSASPSMLDDYLPRREAAAALGIAVETLSRWKARRSGPPVLTVAARDYYGKESLRKWLAQQERDPAAPEPRRARGRPRQRAAAR